MPAGADNQAIALHQMLPPIQKNLDICCLYGLAAGGFNTFAVKNFDRKSCISFSISPIDQKQG